MVECVGNEDGIEDVRVGDVPEPVVGVVVSTLLEVSRLEDVPVGFVGRSESVLLVATGFRSSEPCLRQLIRLGQSRSLCALLKKDHERKEQEKHWIEL